MLKKREKEINSVNPITLGPIRSLASKVRVIITP